MIPSAELIRRLNHELRRFRDDVTEFGKGVYQGVKLCIVIVVDLEANTQKHLRGNPKAVGALVAQIHRVLWSPHKRFTKKAA
jgi:hypothetical protein